MTDASGKSATLELLEKAARETDSLPPVHRWNPEFTGDLDIRIARDGCWYHEGDPIRRQALVRLFSTILLREGDEYFLVTPVEKYRIRVDDAPFVAVDMECLEHEREQKLAFTTNVGTVVVAGPEHPLRVETAAGGEPSPYLLVRDNLEALVHRNVFYRMVELGEHAQRDGKPWLAVRSSGEQFWLGPLDDQ